VAAVEQRVRALKELGHLGWNTLDQLVGAVVKAESVEQLSALEVLTASLNEPAYQRRALEELVRVHTEQV
jgi:hypothetical protein